MFPSDQKLLPPTRKMKINSKPTNTDQPRVSTWIDEVLQIALQYAPEPLPDVAPEMVAKDEKRESDSKERISTH